MEIFKNNIFKKEFERFQKDLLNVLECSYCQKTKCGWKHDKFQPDCQYCRKEFCKNCHKFNKTFEMLLEQADEIDNIAFGNLVSSNIKKIPIKKEIHIKSYVKREKNRSQVVNQKLDNVEKLNYTFKGHKRTFYKKI